MWLNFKQIYSFFLRSWNFVDFQVHRSKVQVLKVMYLCQIMLRYKSEPNLQPNFLSKILSKVIVSTKYLFICNLQKLHFCLLYFLIKSSVQWFWNFCLKYVFFYATDLSFFNSFMHVLDKVNLHNFDVRGIFILNFSFKIWLSPSI